MPRKTSKAERQAWLEDSETGTPIVQIAKRAKRDTRTINKWIDFAIDERDRERARTLRYRDVLRNHDKRLLETLSGFRGELTVTKSEHITPAAHFPQSSLVDRSRISFEIGAPTYTPVVPELGRDAQRMRELLREHLVMEPKAWRDFDRWTDAHGRYVWDCYELGREVGDRITKVTGLPPYAGAGEVDGFTEDFIFWTANIAIEVFLGLVELPVDKPEIINSEQLRRGGSVFADSKDLEALGRGSDEFNPLVEYFSESDEVETVATSFKWLSNNLEKIDSVFADYELLRLIPGRCELCRRIGA